MASVNNPTKYELFCLPLGRVLRPGEAVECTARQAERLADNRVFVLITDEPEPSPDAPAKRGRPARSPVGANED